MDERKSINEMRSYFLLSIKTVVGLGQISILGKQIQGSVYLRNDEETNVPHTWVVNYDIVNKPNINYTTIFINFQSVHSFPNNEFRLGSLITANERVCLDFLYGPFLTVHFLAIISLQLISPSTSQYIRLFAPCQIPHEVYIELLCRSHISPCNGYPSFTHKDLFEELIPEAVHLQSYLIDLVFIWLLIT